MTEPDRRRPPPPAISPVDLSVPGGVPLPDPRTGADAVSAGQRWAGCIAGLALGLTSAGTAAAQQPLPDPSPAAQAPAPDPAPGATARQPVPNAPTATIQGAPAAAVRRAPAAAQATPPPPGGGATAASGAGTAGITPAATRRQPPARPPPPPPPGPPARHRAARAATTTAPQLRLGAVRGAIATLASVASAPRPRAGDGSQRAILTVAGVA